MITSSLYKCKKCYKLQQNLLESKIIFLTQKTIEIPSYIT